MEIHIESLIPRDTTALVGKQNGRTFKDQVVKKFGTLLDLEKSNAKITFIFPTNIITINSSFFLGVFSERIRELGREAFNQKYNFEATEHIKDKIQSHINKALDASPMEDILNV